MSPVFRHGGLRLYLLKLLDEAPRHGYDVIRLLQDRFLGVYSPSPGTIYPRLARLEEEGLVTHEVIDGKKVYRITDAGRAELNGRLDDLADLEDELSASVRDIAREISRDVRETVRSMRDELTWAVREATRAGRESGHESASAAGPAAGAAETAAEPDGEPWSSATEGTGETEAPRGGSADGESAEQTEGTEAPETGQRRPGGDWRDWADWLDWRDWRDWAEWAKQHDWTDLGEWAGRADWKERAKASKQEWRDQAEATKQEWKARAKASKQGWREQSDAHARHAESDLIIDLQKLAATVARELRGVARHAESFSDDAIANLGVILTDTLNRIKNEVFAPPGSARTEPDASSSPPESPAGEQPATDQPPTE